MTEPRIQAANAPDFVWKHLQQDLEDLASALGRSKEDAAIAVHMVLQQILMDSSTMNGMYS